MRISIRLIALVVFVSISIGGLSLAFAQPPNPQSITLNFDELPVGEILTEQYLDQGVVFSHDFEDNLTEGALVETEPAFGTYFFGNSRPNFVIVGIGALTVNFVDPITTERASVSELQVRIGDGDVEPEALGVTAFDTDGNVVTSEIIHLIRDGTTLKMGSPRERISIVRFYGLFIKEASGFAIDDFTYTPVP